MFITWHHFFFDKLSRGIIYIVKYNTLNYDHEIILFISSEIEIILFLSEKYGSPTNGAFMKWGEEVECTSRPIWEIPTTLQFHKQLKSSF